MSIKYKTIEEIYPHCDSVVELPAHLGVYQCPECKHLIISCSMCKRDSCNNCYLEKYKQSYNKIRLIDNVVSNQCNIKCMLEDEMYCKDCTYKKVLEIVRGNFDSEDIIDLYFK